MSGPLIECFGRAWNGRALYLAEIVEVGDAARLEPPPEPFVLIIAIDARGVPSSDLTEMAEALIDAGAAYVCAWGGDSERVHDAFDDVRVGSRADSLDVTTTWHDDDLDEALWFALICAQPGEADSADWALLVVVQSQWAEHARRRLRDTDALISDVLARDP